MSQKEKVVEPPISVNFASSDQLRTWYLDIWSLRGSQFQMVHLFVTSGQDTDEFEDIGSITSSTISAVDSHPDIECIDIGVLENYKYQLNPKAFAIERITGDKEETMFSREWKLDCTKEEITIDKLQSSITYYLKEK